MDYEYLPYKGTKIPPPLIKIIAIHNYDKCTFCVRIEDDNKLGIFSISDIGFIFAHIINTSIMSFVEINNSSFT